MLGWELPPHNSGGLGVACLQLSKALARAGADIDFILPYRHEARYDFMRVTSMFKEGPQPLSMVSIYDSYRHRYDDGNYIDIEANGQQESYARLVGQLARSLEFDIIHAHDWLTFRAALLAREIKSVPVVLHVHSIERDRAGGNPGNPWVREIEATSMLLADHVFAVSERTKQMIVEDYHIPADKIEVVYNSLDISGLEPLDEANAYHYLQDLKSEGWKVISNVGRLTIQKGIPHLIEAASQVVKHYPKSIFLLVGDGEQRDEILELAAQKKIARHVIFTGFQRGKRWRDAYAISDLFVMPSVSEPFGLTPFEAIAYGAPSLVSKQSGVSEIFRNSLKVDFWDINEMVNKIVAVLRSPALQADLTGNAREEYQQLGWERSAGRIMECYHHFAEKAAA